jgi:hypothetical protein
MSWFGDGKHFVKVCGRVVIECLEGVATRYRVMREPRIVSLDVAFEELVSVVYGGNVVVAQLMKEPILHGTKGAFNPPLGLRRGRRQQFNA